MPGTPDANIGYISLKKPKRPTFIVPAVSEPEFAVFRGRVAVSKKF
jgi:hypothetical protein